MGIECAIGITASESLGTACAHLIQFKCTRHSRNDLSYNAIRENLECFNFIRVNSFSLDVSSIILKLSLHIEA